MILTKDNYKDFTFKYNGSGVNAFDTPFEPLYAVNYYGNDKIDTIKLQSRVSGWSGTLPVDYVKKNFTMSSVVVGDCAVNQNQPLYSVTLRSEPETPCCFGNTINDDHIHGTKLTGGSSSYYKVLCKDDEGNQYVAECKHIINAKNMNFNIGNIFKPCFRLGSKDGTTIEYDLEKQIFFAIEELRRIGVVDSNRDVIKLIEKIIGKSVKDYTEE